MAWWMETLARLQYKANMEKFNQKDLVAVSMKGQMRTNGAGGCFRPFAE
jgi:hypothetical protein